MSEFIKRASRAVLALAVAGAFAFGTSQSLAAVAVSGCPDDGENFLGECVSESECDAECKQVAGPFATGICYWDGPDYCCGCLHR